MIANNYLIIIPARGGSKRVKNKNLALVKGEPLIYWTIKIAKKFKHIADIVVSTDSPDIKIYSESEGITITELRPWQLSTDTAKSIDVCRYEYLRHKIINPNVTAVIMLQPTSPFRSVEQIYNGINLFERYKHNTVVAIAKNEENPYWSFNLDDDNLNPLFGLDYHKMRSQEIPNTYSLTGSFYMISVEELMICDSFINKNSKGFLVSKIEKIDIDTEEDIRIANQMDCDL
jgi:CMP-N,N'-diacetyllegionaminic acid synthase